MAGIVGLAAAEIDCCPIRPSHVKGMDRIKVAAGVSGKFDFAASAPSAVM